MKKPIFNNPMPQSLEGTSTVASKRSLDAQMGRGEEIWTQCSSALVLEPLFLLYPDVIFQKTAMLHGWQLSYLILYYS